MCTVSIKVCSCIVPHIFLLKYQKHTCTINKPFSTEFIFVCWCMCMRARVVCARAHSRISRPLRGKMPLPMTQDFVFSSL